MTIIAGTGHRPKYCPCKYNEKHPWLLSLKEDLEYKLEWYSCEGGIDGVIHGCALGWDTWLAQTALKLGLPLLSYVPFEGQGSNWPTASRKIYDDILERSHVVLYLSQEYSPGAFLKRDRAMVNDADHIFALLNPEVNEGGTFYTVQYANEKKKKVTNFWR
jgi:uncharacterized phage-like protein YoqJ